MRELNKEETSEVVGGVYADGEQYKQSQLDYMRRVLGTHTATPGQGVGTPDILERVK